MAKLKISIALAVAVGQLATTAAAQFLPARRDAQKSPPNTAASGPASGASSSAPVPSSDTTNGVPAASASPATAANPAVPPSTASPGTGAVAPAVMPTAVTNPAVVSSPAANQEPATGQPSTVSNQPEPLQPNLLPVVVNQAQPPEVSEAPRTYEHHFTVTLDVANVLWRTSTGYDLFSSNDAAWRIAIGFGYDVLKLPSHMILAAEVGAMAEPGQGSNSNSGLLGNTISGSLSAATFMLGGSLRWAMTQWFAPYGRLGLFTSRYAVDIHAAASDATASSGVDWSYHRWAEGGTLGAGVMFNLPPRSPVNAGVLLEGGYWLQQSVDIRLEGNPPAGSISTSGARLGSLGNSGPYLRFAGLLRF